MLLFVIGSPGPGSIARIKKPQLGRKLSLRKLSYRKLINVHADLRFNTPRWRTLEFLACILSSLTLRFKVRVLDPGLVKCLV